MSGHHHLRAYLNLKRTLDGRKYCRDVAHGRIARPRQHSVQTLDWLVNLLGRRFETHRGVHEVAQDQLGRFRLAIDEQGDGLVSFPVR